MSTSKGFNTSGLPAAERFPEIILPVGAAKLDPPPLHLFFRVARGDDQMPLPNRSTGKAGLVATHRFCFGEVYRHPCSEENDLLSCHRCHLSVVIPKSILTYDQLGDYFQKARQRVDDFRAQVGALAASKPLHEA